MFSIIEKFILYVIVSRIKNNFIHWNEELIRMLAVILDNTFLEEWILLITDVLGM